MNSIYHRPKKKNCRAGQLAFRKQHTCIRTDTTGSSRREDAGKHVRKKCDVHLGLIGLR